MHRIETETMKAGADIIPKKLLCNPQETRSSSKIMH